MFLIKNIFNKKYFKEWLTTKARLQLFSLVVAILAWFFVNSGETALQFRHMKIQYLRMPPGLIFQTTPPKSAKIALRGPLFRLRTIQEDHLIYTIDLHQATPGLKLITLDLNHLRLPIEIEASQPQPRSFHLQLEEVLSKVFSVHPLFLGNLKEGYIIKKVTTHPEIISVTGPRSLISKLENLNVEVDVEGRSQSFAFLMKPQVPFPEVSSPPSVEVRVDIAPFVMTYNFENVLVVIESGLPYRIQPPMAFVVLEGPQKILEGLKGTLKITVPVEGLKKGRYRLRGKVDLPSEVKLVKMEPQSFVVDIEE